LMPTWGMIVSSISWSDITPPKFVHGAGRLVPLQLQPTPLQFGSDTVYPRA
jgi:hypothetical protein